MFVINRNSLWSEGPCDCEKYGKIFVPSIISPSIQKWRIIANRYGKKYNINPTIFLAIASIESGGDYKAISSNGTKHGIVQMELNHVKGFNCLHGTNLQPADLRGNGYYCKNGEQAVGLSFDILGQFISSALKIEDHIGKAITCWNNNIGISKMFSPYEKEECGTWALTTRVSCYGKAVLKIGSQHTKWWNNDYRFTIKLEEIEMNSNEKEIQICFGPKYR